MIKNIFCFRSVQMRGHRSSVAGHPPCGPMPQPVGVYEKVAGGVERLLTRAHRFAVRMRKQLAGRPILARSPCVCGSGGAGEVGDPDATTYAAESARRLAYAQRRDRNGFHFLFKKVFKC